MIYAVGFAVTSPSLMPGGFVMPEVAMPELIRITDDTTIPEIYECIALVSRTADTEGRRLRIDALLDEINARRAGVSA